MSLLFVGVFGRLSGPWVSGDPPVSASQLVTDILELQTPTVMSGFTKVLELKPRFSPLHTRGFTHWAFFSALGNFSEATLRDKEGSTGFLKAGDGKGCSEKGGHTGHGRWVGAFLTEVGRGELELGSWTEEGLLMFSGTTGTTIHYHWQQLTVYFKMAIREDLECSQQRDDKCLRWWSCQLPCSCHYIMHVCIVRSHCTP